MKAGQIVSIRNSTIGGEEIIEGQAKLIKRVDKPTNAALGYELWQVEFTDQPGDYFQRRVANQ